MSDDPAPSDNFPNLFQSTSSYTPSPPQSPSSSSSHDIHNDSSLILNGKDVLVSRLNDLVSRISHAVKLDDDAIHTIHAQVDAIEGLVRNEEESHDASPGARITGSQAVYSSPESIRGTGREIDEHEFWNSSSPNSGKPVRSTLLTKTGSSACEVDDRKTTKPMSTKRAEEIAREAEALASTLTTTVADLQARREESNHIHDLLLTRVEAAASRILYLEWQLSETTSCLSDQITKLQEQIGKLEDEGAEHDDHVMDMQHKIRELEDDVEASGSELRYLRIQLQAIEAQSIPIEYQDSALREGIKSWKKEWEHIGLRSRERRSKYSGSSHGGSIGRSGGDSGLGRSVISLSRSEKMAEFRRSVSEK